MEGRLQRKIEERKFEGGQAGTASIEKSRGSRKQAIEIWWVGRMDGEKREKQAQGTGDRIYCSQGTPAGTSE
jgi:hypothetical protein